MIEGGAEAVKMEGGSRIKESVKAVVNAGIPVIGRKALEMSHTHIDFKVT